MASVPGICGRCNAWAENPTENQEHMLFSPSLLIQLMRIWWGEKHNTVSLLHLWCRREWITDRISRETKWNRRKLNFIFNHVLLSALLLKIDNINQIESVAVKNICSCLKVWMGLIRSSVWIFSHYCHFSSLCVCISWCWWFLVNRKSVLFKFSQENHMNFQHHPLTSHKQTQRRLPSSKVLHLLI